VNIAFGFLHKNTGGVAETRERRATEGAACERVKRCPVVIKVDKRGGGWEDRGTFLTPVQCVKPDRIKKLLSLKHDFYNCMVRDKDCF
jgi:hypothetical protein